MYIIIWEYQVRPEKQTEFEKIYASNGAWAELFKKGNGCLGTELIHSTEHPAQYLTIDRWDSEKNYESFLLQHKEEYKNLDVQCEGLTEKEGCLGKFSGSPIPNIGMSNRVDIFIPYLRD